LALSSFQTLPSSYQTTVRENFRLVLDGYSCPTAADEHELAFQKAPFDVLFELHGHIFDNLRRGDLIDGFANKLGAAIAEQLANPIGYGNVLSVSVDEGNTFTIQFRMCMAGRISDRRCNQFVFGVPSSSVHRLSVASTTARHRSTARNLPFLAAERVGVYPIGSFASLTTLGLPA
jgi:hypothetical protein